MIIPRAQIEAYGAEKYVMPKTITVSAPMKYRENIIDILNIFLPMIEFEIAEKGVISFEEVKLDKKEQYAVKVNTEGIFIQYSDFSGIRNSLATLAQLWKTETEGYSVSFCNIEDYPTFEVRSFMIDMARGIGRKEEIKETIIRLAMLKYNRVHLHLIDSQGVAWQSKICPELSGPQGDQYSMQYFKSLNLLCKKLGLEVLPEIEVPGHNETILKCYPELACEVDETAYPAKWALCAGNNKIFEFYKSIIGELIEMFPDSEYVHIGGDEVHMSDIPNSHCYWDKCPKCQELGYANVQEIYYYVIKRVYDIVKSYDKKVAMWNDWIDISKPCPLPKDILIHFWRVAGEGRGPTEGCSMQGFLEQGYNVINAYFPEAYIDIKDYANKDSIRDWTPVKRPETNEIYHSKILGGEVCAWEFGNERDYRFYRFTVPAPMGMFADRLWNSSVCEYDEVYEAALTRAVLGYMCPEGLNIYSLIGTIMLEAGTTHPAIISDKTPDNKNLQEAILSMIPITVSDAYGHFAALYYTECLNWILKNR